MSDSVTASAAWIPVIGTIVGGILGFAAAFVPKWWDRREERKQSEEARHRDRLEQAYRALTTVRKDYQGMLGQVLTHVHAGQEFALSSDREMPPLIELEMLVSLYLPDLASSWATLRTEKDAFGDKLAGLVSGTVRANGRDERQRICTEFMELQQRVDRAISQMQREIAGQISP